MGLFDRMFGHGQLDDPDHIRAGQELTVPFE